MLVSINKKCLLCHFQLHWLQKSVGDLQVLVLLLVLTNVVLLPIPVKLLAELMHAIMVYHL